MCSKEAKENSHCLICNGRAAVSTRTSLQIFSKEVSLLSNYGYFVVTVSEIIVDIADDEL